MTTELEKLETLKTLFTITSAVYIVISLIMAISLLFITARISEINKEGIAHEQID